MSKFVTRKWIDANDSSGGQYSVNKNITPEVAANPPNSAK